jgi:hypothetical protein
VYFAFSIDETTSRCFHGVFDRLSCQLEAHYFAFQQFCEMEKAVLGVPYRKNG